MRYELISDRTNNLNQNNMLDGRLEAQQDQFELIKPPTKEGYMGTALRGIARTGARATEAALGLPGEIAQGVASIAKGLEGTLEDTESTKLLKSEGPLGYGQPALIGNIMRIFPSLKDVKKLSEYLPTGETIREYITEPISKFVFGSKEYIKPKGKAESVIDAVVRDAVPLIAGKVPMLRAFTAAGFGNLAKWLTSEVGLSKGKQEGVKLGTMLLTNLVGGPLSLGKFAKHYASDLPKNAARQFFKELENASSIQNFINKMPILKHANPVTSLILGGLTGHIKPALGAAGALGGLPYLEKVVRVLKRYPEARKFYMYAMRGAAKQSTPLVAKSIGKLDKIFDHEDKKNSSRYELISR